ncbi:MAG: BrnA antitoxin family protein [Thiohalomonadales bacterium]
MREEYDLKKLKVKRRGVLPGLQGEDVKQAKVRITISLDQDVVDYFKHAAEQPGALPYQTQINQTIRKAIESENPANLETLKAQLLEDPEFLRELAKHINAA